MKTISKYVAAFLMASLALMAGYYAAASGDTDENPETGVITICKMIADASGTILDANSVTTVPTGTYTITSLDGANSPLGPAEDMFGSALFGSPLALNSDLYGSDGVLDAKCLTFSGLSLGNYYYSEEVLSNPELWQAPLMNDMVFGSVSGAGDFAPYNGTLFDGDTSNDDGRDLRSDGHIVISDENDTRTLVVLNRLMEQEEEPVENTEELCTDEQDNDGDQLVDAADPDCAPFQGENGGGGEGEGVENTEPLCTDEQDNDNDQLIDAADPDCAPFQEGGGEGEGVENTEPLCTDEQDNDGDELVDAADPDCAPFQGENGGGGTGGGGTPDPNAENTRPLCSDGLDNDGDNLIDLDDPSCWPAMGIGPGQGGEGSQPTSGGGGGGTLTENTITGGGGVPSSGGTASTGGSSSSEGEVLGESTCALLITSYLRMGANNDPEQVKKLQEFLNGQNLGSTVAVSGIFEQTTHNAVNAFQIKHWQEVLLPWVPFGLPNAQTPTGYVYKTTSRWINMLACPGTVIPMPELP